MSNKTVKELALNVDIAVQTGGKIGPGLKSSFSLMFAQKMFINYSHGKILYKCSHEIFHKMNVQLIIVHMLSVYLVLTVQGWYLYEETCSKEGQLTFDDIW